MRVAVFSSSKFPIFSSPSTPSHSSQLQVIPSLASKLRPHQREGVQFLFDCTMGMKGFEGEGCILADDMGLGEYFCVCVYACVFVIVCYSVYCDTAYLCYIVCIPLCNIVFLSLHVCVPNKVSEYGCVRMCVSYPSHRSSSRYFSMFFLFIFVYVCLSSVLGLSSPSSTFISPLSCLYLFSFFL